MGYSPTYVSSHALFIQIRQHNADNPVGRVCVRLHQPRDDLAEVGEEKQLVRGIEIGLPVVGSVQVVHALVKGVESDQIAGQRLEDVVDLDDFFRPGMLVEPSQHLPQVLSQDVLEPVDASWREEGADCVATLSVLVVVNGREDRAGNCSGRRVITLTRRTASGSLTSHSGVEPCWLVCLPPNGRIYVIDGLRIVKMYFVGSDPNNGPLVTI